MNHSNVLPWDEVRIVATITIIDNNLLWIFILATPMGGIHVQKMIHVQKRATGVSRSLQK